ncbi:dihydropteroate synthase [Legionella sp. W05-934-2]|uniref:dihydropteroate synthase n=1 Tax=Legionella sp. W05-934-2 TaxID=1198649 RepID=UPI003461F54C
MNIQQYRLWHQQLLDASLPKPKPLVMGIVNVTPDSFYDGGKHDKCEQAIEHARLLIAQGVDILDIGGESSRPGAKTVSAQDEMDRILPVIKAIREESDIIISVDTYKTSVMQACVEFGANLINDITGLPDKATRQWLATTNIPLCIMHMQAKPKTMQVAPHYPNGVVLEIKNFLQNRAQECLDDGIEKENIILDPGFGFGKSVEHNLLMIKHLKEFTAMPFPVLLGVSRKSTLGEVTGCPKEDRLAPSIAIAIYSQLQGVGIIRVHDVAETVAAITMLDAITKQQASKEV